ncbi:putative transmembrane protein 217B [Antechinus flavipes]|uniref:putative transmembrane protein 217B n=1 Tax=Antechinus flavipes TaxID=38775 RepID=UPI002235BB4D|nr:putative transmembrane protein 217B [Antechinus flavipes]
MEEKTPSTSKVPTITDIKSDLGIAELGLLWQQKCKISPKWGSCIGGIFTIFMTIQSLILDLNQTTSFGKDPNKFNIYEELSGLVLWTFNRKNNIIILLSITTLLASCILLYSVYMKFYLGLLIYSFWIIIYEIIYCILILLISEAIIPAFQPVKYYLWISQISRMIIHAFWLPFVMIYAYSLFKGPNHLAKKSIHDLPTFDSWSPMGISTHDRKFT